MWHPVFEEMKKESERSKAMNNFKVRCVDLNGWNGGLYKKNEIYTFENGIMKDKYGKQVLEAKFDSFEKFVKYSSSKFELISEPQQFTKDMLKTGMRVETREGDTYIVFLGTEEGDFIQGKWWNWLKTYESDLTSKSESKMDIVKVYSKDLKSNLSDFSAHGELLWQRPEIPKMTHAELAQAVGHEFELVEG